MSPDEARPLYRPLVGRLFIYCHHLFPQKIDTAKALELLPPATRLPDVLTFLEAVLEGQATRRRNGQLLKSLLYAQNLQVTEQLMQRQRVRVDVTEDDVCRACKKRIGQSVFCRTPQGQLYHYSCSTRSQNNPI